MKNIVLSLFALSLFVAPSLAEARCFSFRGESIKVCVEGSNGSARHQAEEVCEGVVGHSCSSSGNSGECRRSSSVRCYDASGEEHDHLNPD
ncbi:MAG TPA: hypothetical protein ENK57_24470 [Polyangiaceae bacterium]|nr:hypothetical protein [Polyangiaceae bacterium]